MNSRPSLDGSYSRRDLDWHPRPYAPAYRSTILRSPKGRRISLESTFAETCGPRFGHDLLGLDDNDLIINYAASGETAIGERIMIHGRLLDEDGRGVPGALIEIWQANAGGRYRHVADDYFAALDPNFGGCGRTITSDEGGYSFRTIKPGPYPWPNGPNDWRPSHVHFSIFGHGFAQRLISQMYFEGDPLIPICPIVSTIPDKKAVDQLTARFDHESTIPMDLRAYRFDVVLRGKASTPFENRPEGN